LAGFSAAELQVQVEDDETDSEDHDDEELKDPMTKEPMTKDPMTNEPMTEKIIEAIQASEARIMAELAKIQTTSPPTQVTKVKLFVMDDDSGSEPEGINEKISLNIQDVVGGQVSKVEDIYIFDTIGMIKEKIWDQLGIDSNTFRLVFNGKTLKDKYNCKDYLIHEGSTLHLLVRLQGGGFSVILVYFIIIISWLIVFCI
jgi:hypothetical protein